MKWTTTDCNGNKKVWYSEDEVMKYKNCLEEIEEFCIVYSDNHDAYERVYKYILDILNKVDNDNN